MKVKLVSSLAGRHEEWDQVLRTGRPALMSAIQSLGARVGKNKDLSIECQVRIPSLMQPIILLIIEDRARASEVTQHNG